MNRIAFSSSARSILSQAGHRRRTPYRDHRGKQILKGGGEMQRTETKGNLGTTICAVFLVKFREYNAENNTRNIFFFLFLFFFLLAIY